MTNQTSVETLLSVEDLRKSYGEVAILDGINFEVNRGEFVCIVGPSGSGKTTLLRSIAGLQPPTSGKTVFEGQVVTEPPAKLAVVFQDYSRSLLPWMSVADNVALPLKGQGGKREISARVEQALISVGLAGKGKLYPWQMSGGMQQRAAIARGLAYNPDVLLMDEPFAAVDAQTRIELEDLVLRLRDEYNTTVLFVTHDIDEAVYLADRVLVLSGAPTRVTENIRTELPNPRNQLETKRLERYGEVREQVFTLIQNAKSHASI
ncbi:ABC transporter ATP-binding protein [Glutamicibacter sp.]|uniref:ABC transporter ATP-binding protein n=1 Tax=Glutamicibacter sp. TaxID=1931995 RepID=UPI002B49D8BB|nr:ABC transporter ATP-binding protein [Glutamicibacter sp.]HJX78354.1 ABC transporter ATP-binding protein [Glutamicibacter sp.]